MADDELFAREEATVASAERRLGDGQFAAPEDREAYEGLLQDYRKLFRTARRLMRLADRNERSEERRVGKEC